jgi:hypothetical protein
MVGEGTEKEKEHKYPNGHAPGAGAFRFRIIKAIAIRAGDLLALALGPQGFDDEAEGVSQDPASTTCEQAGCAVFAAATFWAGASLGWYGFAQEPIREGSEHASDGAHGDVNAESVSWIVLKRGGECAEKNDCRQGRKEDARHVTKGATDFGEPCVGLRDGVDVGTLAKTRRVAVRIGSEVKCFCQLMGSGFSRMPLSGPP